jgi:hypothetical protein
MTRKDYVNLAKELNDLKPENEKFLQYWELVVQKIGKSLSYDNPKFNWTIWNRACGKESIHPKTTLEKGI